MMNSRNRFPFTASQWQELEQQALIYKYMASGIPIPPDLLFSVRRSYLDSPMSARLLSHQPQHVGWNYLQMSLGRKIDPEPGRCRRTDGKKWRCSKEAYPDSKYCERHMHRGKNRSRKPVEALKATPTNTNTSTPQITKHHPSAALAPARHSASAHLSSLSSDHRPQQHSLHHPFLYHTNNNNGSSNASSRPSGNTIGLSFQDNNAPLFFDSGASYSQSNADYRYTYGLKEEEDEHAFFSEPSGTMKSLSASSVDESWQLTPLTMSSSSSSKQRSCSGNLQDYAYLQIQNLSDSTKQQDQDQSSCYGLNGDIKCGIPMRLGNDEPQKTMHHFLDEWPHKGRDSWLDLDDKTSNASSVSTTRLSISIPTSHHDFRTN